MTPAGLGGCVIAMMERGLIDFVISTGANLYHDLHYALNFTLHRGSPFVDDGSSTRKASSASTTCCSRRQVLLDTDSFIRDFLVASGLDGPVSTAELHYALGRHLLSSPPGLRGVFGRGRRREVRRADLHLVARRQLDRHEHRLSRADERQQADGRSRTRTSTRSARSSSPAEKNGCVILGGGSPKNFYLQGQPTLWEVYSIPKGGNDYFIQITTDQVVWGGLSGATPAEAVSWGKVNPGVLPDTCVAYCDSTIAFPLFCEYAVGHQNGRRKRKGLVHKRDRARRPHWNEGRSQTAKLARKGKTAVERRSTWARSGRSWDPRRPRSRRPARLRRRERAGRARRATCAPRCGGTCFS